MYPKLNKVTMNEDNLPSDCNACLRTLRVDHKQAVSLSQPLCTYYNKGSHMLSIVDTWGHMLSWECWQHVGDMSATCQNITNFGSTCVLVPTQKSPRH